MVDGENPEAFVEKLKSQGFFDKIRKKCLEEVENQREYSYLIKSVDNFVSKFLQRQSCPSKLAKLELRERLRRELCATNFFQRNLSKIVDNALHSQPIGTLEPHINYAICESLGVDYKQWLLRSQGKQIPGMYEDRHVRTTLYRVPDQADKGLSFSSKISHHRHQAPTSMICKPLINSSKNVNYCNPGYNISPSTASFPVQRTNMYSLANTIPPPLPLPPGGLLRPTIPLSINPEPPSTMQYIANSSSANTVSDVAVANVHSLIPDEDLDVVVEELLPCDDSMDLESTDSQQSAADQINSSTSPNMIYLPTEELAFGTTESPYSELFEPVDDSNYFPRKDVWHDMNLDLDEISDEDVAHLRFERNLCSKIPSRSSQEYNSANYITSDPAAPFHRRSNVHNHSDRHMNRVSYQRGTLADLWVGRDPFHQPQITCEKSRKTECDSSKSMGDFRKEFSSTRSLERLKKNPHPEVYPDSCGMHDEDSTYHRENPNSNERDDPQSYGIHMEQYEKFQWNDAISRRRRMEMENTSFQTVQRSHPNKEYSPQYSPVAGFRNPDSSRNSLSKYKRDSNKLSSPLRKSHDGAGVRSSNSHGYHGQQFSDSRSSHQSHSIRRHNHGFVSSTSTSPRSTGQILTSSPPSFSSGHASREYRSRNRADVNNSKRDCSNYHRSDKRHPSISSSHSRSSERTGTHRSTSGASSQRCRGQSPRTNSDFHSPRRRSAIPSQWSRSQQLNNRSTNLHSASTSGSEHDSKFRGENQSLRSGFSISPS